MMKLTNLPEFNVMDEFTGNCEVDWTSIIVLVYCMDSSCMRYTRSLVMQLPCIRTSQKTNSTFSKTFSVVKSVRVTFTLNSAGSVWHSDSFTVTLYSLSLISGIINWLGWSACLCVSTVTSQLVAHSVNSSLQWIDNVSFSIAVILSAGCSTKFDDWQCPGEYYYSTIRE